ncbi:hypothetical protein [Paenibacillus amylolyticus]|uniref:hypothetical protein n=1 Tax=Paenibacillus amylolyticus TaxID=1451 RepID=UPI00096C7159|nr:hypothetical protein [Paenibacillus amylolyticus]OMF47712.1 hypothetical protein BK136_02135 [Paenibacillus amylolyticus]
MDHMRTTKCCNHTFTAKDIKPPLMKQQQALGTNDPHIYGGNAKVFAAAECPECNEQYILWMKQQSPNYKVLTISKSQMELDLSTKSKRSSAK